MKIFSNIIKKFFLVKEIISKENQVHFRRYRLLSTPWFNLYLHQILKSDQDNYFHDHPWAFFSLILMGCYEELFTRAPWHDEIFYRRYRVGQIASHSPQDAHSLTLLSPVVWTLVLTTGRERVWGYQVNNKWINFKTYRQLKRDGKLPD
jgi:hypothetical protein